MTTTALASRGRWTAAKLRIGASSVAPVASGYARSLRPSAACFSPSSTTICSVGGL